MIGLENVKLTTEYLKIIKNIDDEFYKNELLTLDWYKERYNENHDGLLLVDDKNYVGYLVSVPIKKELYKAIIGGTLTNDLYVNPKMFLKSSKYYYIASIVILENYRNYGYASMMLRKLFQNNKGKFCALTITKDGFNLASKFMKYKIKINDDVNIFTLNNRSI